MLFAQSRPALQIYAGLAFPQDGLGGDLVMLNDSGISNISSDFVKNNYSVATGATIFGTLKFPLMQTGILNLILVGSYTYFNAFRQSKLGVTVENNLEIPAKFDNRFSATTAGMGVEVSPLGNSKISPFINSSFTINVLSLTLYRNDFSGASFNDAFRMGVLTNAGVSINLSSEYSFLLGMSYHFSNLFLKSHKESFSDRLGFNRANLSINDQEGNFYSNLSDPTSAATLINGNSKNVNWLGFNLGINIFLGKSNKK